MSTTYKAPHLPPEILELIIKQLVRGQSDEEAIPDIRAFRLISKTFANIGLPYLVSTIRLFRLPSSFDKAERIANHRRARFCVEKLICYGDQIHSKCLLRKDKTFGLASIRDKGRDTHRLKRLIHKLPNLRTFQFADLVGDLHFKQSRRRWIISSTLAMISHGSYTCEGFRDTGILDILEHAGHVDRLILSRIDGCAMTRSQRLDFSTLRELTILVGSCSSWPEILYSFGNNLEVLNFRGSVEYYMPISFPLPKSLRCLGLSGVVIQAEYLPRTLDEICLTDIRLEGKTMSGWMNILLNWPRKCELFVTGHLIAESGDGPWYDHIRTSQDRILDTTLGLLLREICSVSRRPSYDLRKALLSELFEREISMAATWDGFRHVPRDIYISDDLKDWYAGADHFPVDKQYPEWARVLWDHEHADYSDHT